MTSNCRRRVWLGRWHNGYPGWRTRGQGAEDALMGSSIVSVFVDVTDAIPGGALGFVPTDFQASFDLLEESMDKEDSS